ncbi:hypothetical protein SDC9_165954 [bioreactor metagenome]|uniref:Uncharacterized protein n=1 Tax=bioreactor metagenome TaxID=1076179 RepID=A0A645G377_9ZZZZ
MEQAQQPLQREHPAGVVVVSRQRTNLDNAERGLQAIALQGHAQIRQHDAQEAGGAQQRLGQRRCAEHAAAQKLEGARCHCLGEQAKALIVEIEYHQVVQAGVAIHRNPAGRFCKIDSAGTQQRTRIAPLACHAGQHAGDETHRHRSAASGLLPDLPGVCRA